MELRVVIRPNNNFAAIALGEGIGVESDAGGNKSIGCVRFRSCAVRISSN